MRVQATRESTAWVDVDTARRTCSCCNDTCEHVELASDLVLDRGRRNRWLVRSAFHKELRRGNVQEARHWAAWMVHCDGRDAPLEYLRKIWSEETANLELAVYLHGSQARLPTAIAWFCHATKVWQMPAWWDVFQAHEEGTMPTGTRAARWSAEMRDAADDDAALAELRDQVLDELSSDGRLTAQQLAVFRTRYESGRFENEDIVLLLLLCSRLPACDVGRPDSLPSVPRRFVDGSTLLLPPVCAYDYHTAVGKARMRAWLAAHPDSGFGFGVDTTPVDLRWAGGLAPLFWRVQAWRQFGSTAGMDATAWHELGVDAEALQRFAAWCGWWPENMVA